MISFQVRKHPPFSVTDNSVAIQKECLEVLKEGDLLAIAPGGAREALFAEVSINGT